MFRQISSSVRGVQAEYEYLKIPSGGECESRLTPRKFQHSGQCLLNYLPDLHYWNYSGVFINYQETKVYFIVSEMYLDHIVKNVCKMRVLCSI